MLFERLQVKIDSRSSIALVMIFDLSRLVVLGGYKQLFM
uniref:Uncharacterized protein n=1 Tax=Lepeophtheirus salmonis TaxID=72036 RepID=A0A0K2UB29_LEPSM